MDESNTFDILKQLEEGKITAQEANEKLATPPKVQREDAMRVDKSPAPTWVRDAWWYLLIAGLSVAGIGAWIITATVASNALWFLCGLPLVLLGSVILSLATILRDGHWLYFRVEKTGRRGHNVHFALPFPIGLVRVGLWFARRMKPNLKAKMSVTTSRSRFNAVWDDAEEFMRAVERELSANNPLVVEVHDKDGRVQVYIV